MCKYNNSGRYLGIIANKNVLKTCFINGSIFRTVNSHIISNCCPPPAYNMQYISLLNFFRDILAFLESALSLLYFLYYIWIQRGQFLNNLCCIKDSLVLTI